MKTMGRIGLLAALLVAGCGGGGGGGGGTVTAAAGSSAPAAVVITQDNAKPVGADASGSVQNTSATQGTAGLIAGVQVQADAAQQEPGTVALADAVRAVVMRARATPALASGVVINPTTEACSLGGTMTLSGNVAGGVGITAGDTLSMSANGCSESLGGQTVTISGNMTLTVSSGVMAVSPPVYPFSIVINIVTNNLTVTIGGVTQTSTGDMRLAWSASSPTVQTMTASGVALANGSGSTTASRTVTWRNYSQSIGLNGSTRTASLSASVESANTRLGANGGSYSITTPTPVQWNASTGLASAGVIRVTGANNSAARITFSGATATVEVDADGNGTFESTVNTTPTELRSLL